MSRPNRISFKDFRDKEVEKKLSSGVQDSINIASSIGEEGVMESGIRVMGRSLKLVDEMFQSIGGDLATTAIKESDLPSMAMATWAWLEKAKNSISSNADPEILRALIARGGEVKPLVENLLILDRTAALEEIKSLSNDIITRSFELFVIDTEKVFKEMVEQVRGLEGFQRILSETRVAMLEAAEVPAPEVSAAPASARATTLTHRAPWREGGQDL